MYQCFGLFVVVVACCVPAVYLVVPQPAHILIMDETKYGLPESFAFNFGEMQNCDVLTSAAVRYWRIMFDGYSLDQEMADIESVFQPVPSTGTVGDLQTLDVIVKSKICAEYPKFRSDESYNLSITGTNTTLTANTIWGALRGLETFSQLVEVGDDGSRSVPWVTVGDAPRFPFRGFLIDTSRHFLSISSILTHIELMAQNKMNVLHWHMTDDQSFPYFSDEFPELALYGSYRPYSRHVYTSTDIDRVVEFARLRGIQVMVEFDSPAHSRSFGKGLPNMLTPCEDKNGKPTGQRDLIYPIDDNVYKNLTLLFAEAQRRFKSDFVHLGFDEVSWSCWAKNSAIKEFMKSNGLKDFYALENYYYNTLMESIKPHISPYTMVWEEALENKIELSKNTIVNVWKSGNTELAASTKAGHPTIKSADYYMNYFVYGNTRVSGAYAADPQAFNGTAEQKALIWGGEACMWGEWVDSSNLIQRSWPRSSAVAERLWSPADVKDYRAFEQRAHVFRCELVRRGFQVEPIVQSQFCRVEWDEKLSAAKLARLLQ